MGSNSKDELDDLAAFFEEDGDLGSDIESDEDGKSSVDAIKDENSKLKEQLRLLQKQLEEKSANKEVSNSKTPVAKSKFAEKPIEQDYQKKSESVKADDDFPFKKKQRSAHVGTKREVAMERNTMDHANAKKATKPIAKPKEIKKEMPKVDTEPYTTEAYSGIKIIKPLISSQTMDDRMEGRNFVKMNMLLKRLNKNDIHGDWVTVGVLVNKLPPKLASNGKTFSIWKLSDLSVGSENDTVTLFLFGDVYKEHWKTGEGTVVGLLNATIMPRRDNDQIGNVAISIDDPRKMMIMGRSKDMGRCKGGTKSGKQCSFIVNKSHGNYCEHHITREYKKVKSQRMEFQSGSGPDPKKGNLMKKFKKEVESGSYNYGGETLTWTDRPDPNKKQNNKKLTLADIAGAGSNEFVKKELADFDLFGGESKTKDTPSADQMSDDLKNRLQIPTAGSRNLIRLMKKEETEEKENSTTTKPDSKSARDLLNAEKKQIKKSKTKPIDMKLPMFKTPPPSNSARRFSADFKPKLARGFDEDDDIEFADFGSVVSNSLDRKFEENESPLMRNAASRLTGKSGMKSDPVKKSDIAKRKALSIVRSKGIKFDKEEKSTKKSPENMTKINERVLQDISAEAENCEPAKKRRKGILEDAFGPLELDSEEGQRILKSKSIHANKVEQAELEREAAYFNALEKKEMFEEKMQNITEMKVKVVCCKICKYMHEFQSSHCKKQGHPTVRVEAMKRFFACKSCKHRTIGYKKLPDEACKNCGANNYERVSMYQEKKGPKLGSETLLVRGEEHSRFLNGLK